MGKSYYKSILEWVIIFIAAYAFWIFAMDDSNPIVEKVIQIPLEIKNLSINYVVANKPDKIEIKIRGSRDNMANLKDHNIIGTVDLKDVRLLGKQNFKININIPDKIQLLTLSPEVYLDIKALKRKNVPVKINIIKESKKIYLVKEIRAVKNISVYGMEDNVNNIVKAMLNVNLKNIINISSDIVIEVEPMFIDFKGNEINNLSSVPVKIPVIIKFYNEKVFLIKAKFKVNTTNYKENHYKIEPKNILIFGEKEEIDKINFIETLPIDIEIFSNTNKKYPISLNIPKKIKTYPSDQVFYCILYD